MTSKNLETTNAASRKGESGSALIMALLMTTILFLLGATFMVVSMTDRRIAANEADGMAAFNLAEAGIEHAVAELPGQDIDTLLSGGGVLLSNQSLAKGTYGVVVTNNVGAGFPTGIVPLDAGGASSDTDGFLVLTATGQVNRAERVVQLIVEGQNGMFDYAVWSDKKLNVSSSGFTDSYDSTAGAYAPGGSDGDVFSNTEIKMSGSSMINGDADSAGPIDNSTHVSGTTTELGPTEPVPALITCPGSYTPSVPAGSGVSYDSGTGKLTVSGGNNLVLPVPPTSYYFSEIKLSGGSTLEFDNASGDHVDVYVSSKLDVSGGGLVNGSSAPPLLAIWACGPSTGDFKLSGGSGAYFTIYAPNRKVDISGTGDLWGAIIAGEFNSSGGSKVHYDTSLGGGNGFARLPNSWVEIF